jgi:hypothetical protein
MSVYEKKFFLLKIDFLNFIALNEVIRENLKRYIKGM